MIENTARTAALVVGYWTLDAFTIVANLMSMQGCDGQPFPRGRALAIGLVTGWSGAPVDSGGAAPSTANRGIGLANLRSRLHCLYGSAGEVALERSALGGMSVRVRLPLRWAEVGA